MWYNYYRKKKGRNKMYKITVLQSNKCPVIVRYCFRKKTMKNLAKKFISWDWDITIEKFTRLYSNIFCWSEANSKGFFIDQIEKEIKEERK